MLSIFLFRKLIFSDRASALVKRIAQLSVLGIGISVSAFLIVLFVMTGMNQSIRSRILALEPHLVIKCLGVPWNFDLESLPVFLRLKEDPEKKILQFESQDLVLRTQDGQFRGVQARGLTEESFRIFIEELRRLNEEKKRKSLQSHQDFAEDILNYEPGESWTGEDIPGPEELIVGVDLARSLNLFEGDFLTAVAPEDLLLPLGETPKFARLRVKKIIATDLADLDSQIAFYQKGKSLMSFQSSPNRESGFEVWLPDGIKARAEKEKLSQFENLQIETWEERNSALFFALRLEKTMIGVFLGLAGLISGFSILGVMALLISQKRADLGMLKALGLSNRRSAALFTQIGAWLGGAGLVIGLIMGTSLGLYLEKFPVRGVLPSIYYDQHIPAYVDWGFLFLTFLFGALFVALGAWLPSRSLLNLSVKDILARRNP